MTPRVFDFALPEWLDEVDSTNNALKARLAAGGLTSGCVLAARRQTRGRGRLDAVWQSSPGGDLTFSFYWEGETEPLRAGTLPMACALGVRDFLARPPWRLAAVCKWPNDVLVDDAKICGILTEGGVREGGRMGLAIGIGVNVRRWPGRDANLGRRTATLADHCPEVEAMPVEDLLGLLLQDLSGWIGRWAGGGFAALRGELQECLWGVGKAVTTRTAKGTVSGVVAGLGEGGELVLRLEDGTERRVASVTALEGW